MRRITWLLGLGGVALLGGALAPADAGSPRSRQDEIIELGRRLFMDPTVSRSGRFSCASCHEPEHGFSDPRPFSVDENGETKRHSQTVLNLANGQSMHWDGEFDTVRELAIARLAPPAETLELSRNLHTRHFEAARSRGDRPSEKEFKKRLRSLTPPYYGPATTPATRRAGRRVPIPVPLVHRLETDDRYDAGFRKAYGSTTITTDRVVAAIEAYTLSLESGASPYDRYAAGDPEAISESARRGLRLFVGKANCAACHTTGGGGALAQFTDNEFHNTGVAFKRVSLDFEGGFKADGGRGEMSFVAHDLGRFKTPGLRDVARRAPYMHDGGLKSLEEVVRYYDRGGTPNARLDGKIRKLGLSDTEVADLVAFLESLTSDERPGIGPMPIGPRRARIRIEDLRGKPLRNLAVEIHPFGDRLAGARSRDAEPRRVATDHAGVLKFTFPPWTHVMLKAEGHEIHFDWPIPDCATKMTVMAAPRDVVAMTVRAPAALPKKITASLAGTTDPQIFTRVRTLGGTRGGVYVADRRGRYGRVNVMFDFAPRGGTSALREIDLSGGWTEPIDLRP